MTATQSKVALSLTCNGWIIKKLEMIGRKLFIAADKPGVNVFTDQQFMGTVGPSGKVEVEYYQFSYKESITEMWRLEYRITGK